jgi:hypothetical protein
VQRSAKSAGKAAAKAVKAPRKARKPTALPINPDARISISEAFQHFLRFCDGAGHLASEQFDGALRLGGGAPGGVRLWVGGIIVDPDWYRSHMRVAAKVASDGQWSAELEPSGLRPVEPGPYPWSVSARNVAALTMKSAVGRSSIDREWFQREAAAYVLANGLPEPPTAEALYLELHNLLGELCPSRTVAIDILSPFVRRMKEALRR